MFHLGVLWRLNGAAMLSTLARVSSVSGGSITAGVLAMNWAQLAFNEAGVAKKVRFSGGGTAPRDGWNKRRCRICAGGRWAPVHIDFRPGRKSLS